MTSTPDTPVITRTVEIRDDPHPAWSVTASVITIDRKERTDPLGHAVGIEAQLHVVLPDEAAPDIYFLSRLVGERHWVQDAHFGPQGQPYFVHGFGTRITLMHGIHPALEAVLDAAALQRELVSDIRMGIPLALAINP